MELELAIPSDMTPSQRTPVLCEIIRKTEHLQIRAVAQLLSDAAYEGSWSSFCKCEFGWDDSYASRMRSAAKMFLDGTPITTEAQARVLSSVEPEKRAEVIERAREANGGVEPSASDIRAVIGEDDEEEGSTMAADKAAIESVLADLRSAMKKAKALPIKGAGRWLNQQHLMADIKNAASELKHAAPHGPCDEWGPHNENCLCGGSGWLPKHVLERPKQEGEAK